MFADSTQDRQQRLSELLAFVQSKKRDVENANLDKAENASKQEDDTKTPPVSQDSKEPPIKKAKTTPAPISTPPPRPKKKAMLPDYAFLQDDKTPQLLDLELKSSVDVRPYQKEALDAIVDRTHADPKQHVARSGIIVLPCGAGKTLTSILVANVIKKPILVVCSTIIAAEQFSKEFLSFTSLMASRTGMFAGAKKWPYNGPSGVLFTTYTMLVENKNRTADSKRMSQFIDKTQWGLVILDEVHQVPANNYAKAISKIKTKVRLGLTATMLREDEKIGDLETLVGPTLYHAKWKELADRGYIAKVICTQIESDMTPIIKTAYEGVKAPGGVLGHAHHLKSLLSILNPKKMQICQRLIQYHETKGDKVLVYCDHIDALKLYAETMNRPYIYGGTPNDEAAQLLTRFQIDVPPISDDLPWNEQARIRRLKANQISTLFLSRIGDTSLNLPAATVLIQVSSHFGSRRQEAQRLGRVLRAKKRSEKGFYSRFYTLVTNDTSEVQFSEKRRQFLEEDCGYGYQIWKVGDEQEGGWAVTDNLDHTRPEDDEVQTDPLTCTIKGAGDRPYATDDDQRGLVKFLNALKNIKVEEEDDDAPAQPKKK
jgi:DNA repair helicase Rad25